MGLLVVVFTSYSGVVDYNGSPLDKRQKGGVILTSQTSPAIIASYTQAINLDGLLDGTFGSLGVKTNTIGTNCDVHGVAIQSDGKVVVVGGATVGTNMFTVIRYNVDGSLDSSFGNGTGYVTTAMGNDDIATGVVLQPDGKIVVGGYAQPIALGYHQFAVVRYNTNGTLDTTFNAGGPTPGINLTTLIAGQDATANGIALQPDGKIVLGGRTRDGGPTRFGLVRYNANGTLDTTTFGAGTGIVVTPSMGGADDTGQAVALQSDGKIVLVGKSLNGIYRFATARYTADGTLDTATFGNGLGYVLTSIGGVASFAFAVVIQSDQKIVVGGSMNTGTTCAVARYTTTGVLDVSFGSGIGYVTTPITVNGVVGTAGQINKLALQPDTKIIAAGQITLGGLQQFALARYNFDGSLDTSFGSGATGYLTTAIGGVASPAKALAIQPDNKLVVAGKSGVIFATVRYINPFTLASFTASYGSIGLL